MIYAATIIPIIDRYEIGIGTNPNKLPMGIKGNDNVKSIVERVEISKKLRGLLFKNDFLVRITRTINDADIMDSTNQVVLNTSKVEFNTNKIIKKTI
jgi:hypothetical protein